MVHELGLICTYPASVQEAISPKSCKRVKGCIDPVDTAGSERSAGKYVTITIDSSNKCIMIRLKHDAPTYHMLLDMVWEIS